MSIPACNNTSHIVQFFLSVEKDTGMLENLKTFIELENNIPYQIDYTSNFNKSFRREFQLKYIQENVTPDEFAILYIIHYIPDISQSELAKLLFKGKAHVGKILNDMESRGIIKRIADTRENLIIKRNEITPKGQEIFEKGHSEFEKIKEIMGREFPEEDRKQFIQYLKKFRNILNSIVDVKLK